MTDATGRSLDHRDSAGVRIEGRVYCPVTTRWRSDSVANQFAAMPSLHFGWAVMVALGAIRASRSRYRVLWVAHPIITLLVIVGTANHYWLDAAVAGGLIIASEYALATWWRAARSASARRCDCCHAPATSRTNLSQNVGAAALPSRIGHVTCLRHLHLGTPSPARPWTASTFGCSEREWGNHIRGHARPGR